jgi:starch phosphorylase
VHQEEASRRIAYFSMEVAIASAIPTYAGGLGVLAGDTLRSFADLRVPAVGVTLLYRKGYFRQSIDDFGVQRESPVEWDVSRLLRPLPPIVEVTIESRPVKVRAWRYNIAGLGGYEIPVILLDTDLEGNADRDRFLTHWLYGGDQRYRLAQEAILGFGGVRMLNALGYTGIEKFHMNEGHASLMLIQLLRSEGSVPSKLDFETVRNRCIFTTHTPVAAGHDQFDYGLVRDVIGESISFEVLQMLAGRPALNMTLLGLNLSRYVNGVAKRHEEVSRAMFPGYPIHHITNGVHAWTWTSHHFKALYDEALPGWAEDPPLLRKAVNISADSIWSAHIAAKRELVDFVNQRTKASFSLEPLTIGFARRATQYKRADLVFSDLGRLRRIVEAHGPIQFVFAGKAHPQDEPGKHLIQRIRTLSREFRDALKIVYLEDYDFDMARLITSGVDLWLNTPQRPLEASGTSGMKAALNGIPSLSTLDGWWLEGHIEGITGWSVGSKDPSDPHEAEQDAADLYRKLEDVIVPLFYTNRANWLNVMRHTIALNGSYFTTHRMVQQYVTNAYLV